MILNYLIKNEVDKVDRIKLKHARSPFNYDQQALRRIAGADDLFLSFHEPYHFLLVILRFYDFKRGSPLLIIGRQA